MKPKSRTLPLLLMGLLLSLVVATSVASAQQNRDLDAWLREAGLGPYAPEEEDWDAIYEKAKNEPPLQVYMSTSPAVLRSSPTSSASSGRECASRKSTSPNPT